MTIELTPEDAKTYADILTDIAERIRSGKLKVTSITQSRPCERWWGPKGWEFFKLGDITMTFVYHNPEHRKQELERREIYQKANPTAVEENAPWPVIALNGIPRGVCNAYSLEEGWVQYVVPKSGNHSDYSVEDAPMEMRRYHGKVTIVGHSDPAKNVSWENDPLREIYERIPEGTPVLPAEAYEVVPWEPMTWGKKILRSEPGYLL
jgi:hypothetical protein